MLECMNGKMKKRTKMIMKMKKLNLVTEICKDAWPCVSTQNALEPGTWNLKPGTLNFKPETLN
jgi:hypothetical protein